MRHLLALALVACGAEDSTSEESDDTAALDTTPAVDTSVTGTCDATGGRMHWVFDSLRFVGHDGDTTDGFDLDGFDTEAGDREGCGKPDKLGPNGEPGIDNAFGGLLPVLNNTEFVAAEGLIQDTIRSGLLLVLGELAGVDDLDNDECVRVAIRGGQGTPLLGTDGSFLAGQTFDLDHDFPQDDLGEHAIVDGALEAGPFDFQLPLTVLDTSVVVPIQSAWIRMNLQDDGTARGVLSGGLALEALLGIASTGGINDEVAGVLAPVAQGALDLVPDDEGTCTQLSVSVAFTATPVYVYEDVWED